MKSRVNYAEVLHAARPTADKVDPYITYLVSLFNNIHCAPNRFSIV